MPNVRKTSSTRPVIYDLASARERTAAPVQDQPVDEAGFSEEARTLARARAAVEQAPDVRAERVAELRAQIARGEYRPDPAEIARKIIERGL